MLQTDTCIHFLHRPFCVCFETVKNSGVYKVFCNVLNQGLTERAECNRKITDFRLAKKPTFVAFVDFSKAYNTINRKLLWNKLNSYGIRVKMFQSLCSLYSNAICAVKVNHLLTDWLSVRSGLKQGCIVSALLFNLYTNVFSDALSKLT